MTPAPETDNTVLNASPQRLDILGLPVDAVNMQSALEYVENHISNEKDAGCILAANPEKIYAARRSSLLQNLFEHAALIVPDGIGVVFAMRRLHGIRTRRVPGADLMQEICGLSAKKGFRIFLYGAKEDVNRKATEELKNRYPEIQIAGRANGYVGQEEMPALIRQINDSKTDILFVALGSPKQEEWLEKHLPQLKVKLCQGIGGTLDTIAGTVKRAPIFMQKLNLEWFFRLLMQPSRFFRQRVLLAFMWELVKK